MSWTVSFAASLCILVGLGVLAAMVRRCWLKKYVNAFYVVVGGDFNIWYSNWFTDFALSQSNV